MLTRPRIERTATSTSFHPRRSTLALTLLVGLGFVAVSVAAFSDQHSVQWYELLAGLFGLGLAGFALYGAFSGDPLLLVTADGIAAPLFSSSTLRPWGEVTDVRMETSAGAITVLRVHLDDPRRPGRSPTLNVPAMLLPARRRQVLAEIEGLRRLPRSRPDPDRPA